MAKADLHVHTTASDGEYSPTKIVNLSKDKGLLAVAVTDHDTTKGVVEAIDASMNLGVKVIPGIEISAVYDPGTLHMLGYFPCYPEGLEEDLERIQKGRLDRFPKIIEKLNSLNVGISVEDVMQIAGDAQVGRPHIAKAIIKKGYAKDFDEVFEKWLGKGKPCYVEKDKLTWEEAIKLITLHKGISVLAHPFTLELDNENLMAFVLKMKGAGLSGIEVNYPEHTTDKIRLYKKIADDAGLILTGGTDFHSPDRSAGLGECGIEKESFRIFEDRLRI
jgi:hypothetical protein